MPTDLQNAMWLSQSETVSIAELTRLSGLAETDVRELVDYGVLTPENPQAADWLFSATSVAILRRASRLRNDLELDLHGVALTLGLLDHISQLEANVARLRAQQPQPYDR